ncbi:MAG: hypothetical protein H7A42_08225 [Chlamydiales bacterium]|nr:hypothetical protein [Chlamydiales bacterium]
MLEDSLDILPFVPHEDNIDLSPKQEHDVSASGIMDVFDNPLQWDS